ncbi:hypothetical protein [Burkholderia anthina]|uniref:hypothetical protein n=1 Tax=Burkholderia anthina TaxID=179879 RepID=UPI0012D88099|nr:hypothetical protein [Burkholderia anthina]
MNFPDGMQRIPEDRGDIRKVGCAVVIEYFDQQIATVINRPNPESNQVRHRAFFRCESAR